MLHWRSSGRGVGLHRDVPNLPSSWPEVVVSYFQSTGTNQLVPWWRRLIAFAIEINVGSIRPATRAGALFMFLST